jgi:GNAT superfamily N-acetyltransferase
LTKKFRRFRFGFMTNASLPIYRQAAPRDEAFLFRLYVTTRADELAGTGWPAAQQAQFLRSQYTARQSSYRATFPRPEIQIASIGPAPVGAVIVHRSDEEMRVVDIAFLPAYRGKGYGTAWLRDRQAEARTAGKPLRLHALKQSRAVILYLRLGFAPAGENGLYLKMEWRG